MHWHACTRCRRVQYDDNCTEPDIDRLCMRCRGGRPWQLLLQNRAPRTCCREVSRLATKDEKKSYSLAGSGRWWICQACARTQPFNPMKEFLDP